ncbi:putative transcription factor interactor and regulator CCHC(Zn) family [Dioscorea sansibarensis]
MGSIRERRVMDNAIDDSGRGQRNRRINQARHEGTSNDTPEYTPETEGDQNAQPSQGNQTGVLQLVEAFTRVLTDITKNRNLHNGILEFKKLDPPAFKGSADPLDADEWLEEIEKIFSVTNFDDNQKVLYATFMLQGVAYDWLKMEKLTHKLNPEPYTWEKFKTTFYNRYFPRYLRHQKENEFINLQQGDMSVYEYENEFYRLVRYALEPFSTEETWVQRFRQGLKPEIRLGLAFFEFETVSEVASKAKLVEWGLNEVQKENERHQKKRFRSTHLQVGEDGPPKKLDTQGRDGKSTLDNGGQCCRCGGFHDETNCHSNARACFGCGQKGHLVADCPHKRS